MARRPDRNHSSPARAAPQRRAQPSCWSRCRAKPSAPRWPYGQDGNIATAAMSPSRPEKPGPRIAAPRPIFPFVAPRAVQALRRHRRERAFVGAEDRQSEQIRTCRRNGYFERRVKSILTVRRPYWSQRRVDPVAQKRVDGMTPNVRSGHRANERPRDKPPQRKSGRTPSEGSLVT